MVKLLSKLRGGDRRSIGKVAEVVTAVRKKPDLFNDLVIGLFDEDPLVRMRAADAMEKISSDNPEFLQPFKGKLIRLARVTRQQELRWHMAQMIPRLKLTPNETATATEIFFEYLKDKSKIVVTFAMQALADLTLKKPDISIRVIRTIEKLARTGSPAIQSRGKKLLVQLKKTFAKTPARKDTTKMKNQQQEDQWVWVVVQNPGDQEQFLGQYDQQEDIAFIPAFQTKEDAQQCFMNMARRKSCTYEVQAILYEELAKEAAADGFMIFLLNENGQVLEKIKP